MLYKKFCVGYRKKTLYTMREIDYWNRLPREVVKSPFLEKIKIQLDRVLDGPSTTFSKAVHSTEG